MQQAERGGNYIIMGGGNGSGIIHCNMAVNVDSTVVGGPACARNAVRGAWNDTQVKQEHRLPRGNRRIANEIPLLLPLPSNREL